jgi:alpha-glucosidase
VAPAAARRDRLKPCRAFSLLLGFAAAALSVSARNIVIVGAATNYYFDSAGGTNRAVFHFTNGVCEVVPYAPDVVRVRYHWNGLWEKDDVAIATPLTAWPAFTRHFTNGPGKVILQLPQLTVEVFTGSWFHVDFKDPSGYALLRGHRFEYDTTYNNLGDSTYTNLGYANTLPDDSQVKAIQEMPDNEAYFGLGEYPGPLNRRSKGLQGWNSDCYSWGEDKNPMYMTLPMLYGVRPETPENPAFAYGLFFNNPSRPVFRMGTESLYFPTNVFSFEAGEGQVDYFFFGGGASHSMRDVLQRYAELIGRPAMLPKWGLGYHLARWSYDNQAWVEWLADTFANDPSSNFPLDAIYLDIDYMDLDNDGDYEDNLCRQLQFNSNFPSPSNMAAYCSARGVKLVPIIEPWINRWHPALFDEASNLYHYVKFNSDSSAAVISFFFGTAAFLDFTSTPTRDWWKGKLVGFLNQYPFQGIWNDLSEPADGDGRYGRSDLMGRDALYYMDGRFGLSSTDTRRQHIAVKNTYCVWETRCSYDALAERYPDQRPFVLTRGGWPGVQRYALNWSGDNKYTYDHLRHNIRLGNSVMISGQANFGHDIGGFSHGGGDPLTDTTPELITRWHQWGALNPLCRNHSRKYNMEREPFRFDRDHYSWMKDIIQFRYRLMPYLYTLAYNSSTGGVPMNAPAVFYFAGDTNTHANNEYDILVGEGLLAAPVHAEGARTRAVYLPAGASWHSWHDGSKFAGGQWVTAPAPEGRLPLFAREGAIIPMGPPLQHMNQFQPDFVDVHVWPATNETAFLMFEDDGESFDYLSGGYARTLFTSREFANRWVAGAGAREGSYNPYVAGTRSLRFIGHDLPPVVNVQLDGAPMVRVGTAAALGSLSQGWAYDSAARTLTVKMPETGAARQIVAYFAWPADSDGDGMPDGWEAAHGLNPLVNDASGNPDGDNRDNLAEYHAVSDPQVADTFFSYYSTMSIPGTFNLWDPAARQMKLVGHQVWAAVLSFTNLSGAQFKFAANDGWPVNWGDNNQSDFDPPAEGGADFGSGSNIGLGGTLTGAYTFVFNESTLAYGVYPAWSRDSDGDGMTDGQEQHDGLNPLSRADRVEDADGDGMGNYAETVAGTSPISFSSYLWLTPAPAGQSPNPAGRFIFSWERVTGRLYDVYYATGWPSGWLPLPGQTNLGGSGTMSVTDDVGVVESRRYKVRVRKP